MKYEMISATDEELLKRLEALRVPESSGTAQKNELGSEAELSLVQDEAVELVVHAQLFKVDLGTETAIFIGVECDPKAFNVVYVGGKQLLAKNLTWGYGKIEWRAGYGWPLYTTPCPRGNVLPSHKLFANVGGKWFAPCETPYSAEGYQAAPVKFVIDDDKRDDNTGSFVVIITGYSV